MLIKAIAAGHYCRVCEKSMAQEETVSHISAMEAEHRFHRECLRKSLTTIRQVEFLWCPVCHERVDAAILKSRGERFIQDLVKKVYCVCQEMLGNEDSGIFVVAAVVCVIAGEVLFSTHSR